MADTPAASSSGGGGFTGTLKSKFGPLPVWAWLAIITVILLGYYLYEQYKSGGSSASQQTTSNAGQPGVVVINQDDAGEGDTDGGGGKKKRKRKPKPKPKGHGGGRHPPHEPHTKQVTVGRDETLRQLASQRHWSDRTLRQVEEQNVMQGGGELTPGSELDKGQEILRPMRRS